MIKPLYLAGEFVLTSEYTEIVNPFDNSLIAKVSLANEDVLESAIHLAYESFAETKKLSSYKKYQILIQIAQSIEKEKKSFAHLIVQEAAKPYKYAIAEVNRAIQTFITAAEESKRGAYEYFDLDITPDEMPREAYVKRFPVGTILAITPFNFPLNLVAHKVAPAIAAGCPFILKPASSTPLTALKLAEIIHQTDFPKSACSVLPCKSSLIEKYLNHTLIKKISFTGSPEVGWKIKSIAPKKKITLELGGNAANIITDTANVTSIINHCVTAAFAYSGQICIHAQRFFVHPKLFDEFLELFIKKTKTLKYGHPADKNTDISVMIDEENAIRTEKWVNEALEKGAQLLCGGKRNENYFEPTIFTNTNSLMKVYSEEVFAPIVCIEKYDGTIEDAVKKVNDSKYGLQCGVFTNNIKELSYCFENIECGGIIHNATSILRLDAMPYGGMKESGFGREGVKYAILEMTEPKLLLKEK
ncbi:MAG: aldehyde dehydrogenase family protein [Bacteroidia bacterium]|nr:aldehyde dehydrogenase family protein [Bacteroidia bacterium]